MKTTLTALPAGAGVFRIPSFKVADVTVPFTTALFIDDQWVSFIDGESMSRQFAWGDVNLSLHLCIANYLHRQGRNPSLKIVIDGGK